MNDLWVSAAVAAAVTLVIEYVAKPGLEARKDRILDSARNLRRLRGTVQHLYRSVIYLSAGPIWEGSLGLVRAELDKCDELNERLTDLTVEAIGRIPKGPRTLGRLYWIREGSDPAGPADTRCQGICERPH